MVGMTRDEFLLARIVEVEQAAQDHVLEMSHQEFSAITTLAQVMRETLKLHQQWPVLVSTPPELEFEQIDANSFAYFATQKFNWATTEEYIKRFGTEPPTSNMIRTWLIGYQFHPDFRLEWLS